MPRHLLVSGASGLIGTPLVEHLEAKGHRVTRLVRRPAGKNEVSWDPLGPGLDLSSLPRVDAVVNLAGENIATRWTSAARRRIHDSRVFGTQLLSRAIARLQPRPEVMVSASAIGIYGDRGDQELRETSPVGDPARDFLVSVCLGWEAAAEEARQAGIRVVHPRFGVVLGREGGALKKMLPA
ncbi:MAG TPA: NAD-dependent epimerase/dehydratase family protein, partial [Gemmatimonadales bacterium]|nr:NAD-dependent epimerase/dehydratase family protein [Gemmatimonadales bacterium]